MKILRYADVARICGVTKQTIRRWSTSSDYRHMGFPSPLDLGANSVGFVEAEVEAWLEARAALRDAPEAA